MICIHTTHPYSMTHFHASTNTCMHTRLQEDDQKWKICAPSKEDLEDWCKGAMTIRD